MTKDRREALLRAGVTDHGEEFHWSASVELRDFEVVTVPALNWAELRELLSQERTCSTCHYSTGPRGKWGRFFKCMNGGSVTYKRVVNNDFGCTLWREKADPEAKGENT